MKALLLLCVVSLACACTPHEVRCEGRLEPINLPAVTGAGQRPVAVAAPEGRL